MKAAIIGGGIIGLSSAYYLLRDGWEVTVIDRTDLSDGCSYGNLGMIVPSHFVPLAAPGIVSQGIRWMFSSSSPFYVKPALSPQLIGWGMKFIRSANTKHVEASATHLKEINLLSKQLYEDIAKEPGFDFAFEKKGIVMYFKTPEVADEEYHMAETARRMGLDVADLTAAEARALEPQARPDVIGAVHYRCDAHLYPNRLMEQLIRWLRSKGVQFLTCAPVQKIKHSGNRIRSVMAGGTEVQADTFVLAAGSWMPELARLAGVNLSLMPGKGYSFMQQPAAQLQYPSILCEARVAITPMQNTIRYGGTMEIGAVNDKVNMNRVRGIVDSIPGYLPGLNVRMPDREQVWFGFRPCSPDGLPYIGYATRHENLLIAGGHAMMGLSLGPATGLLIAELALRRKTSIDVRAFDPSRFG